MQVTLDTLILTKIKKKHLQAAQNKCIRFCLKLCDRTSINTNEFEKINWLPNHNTTCSPKKYYDNRRTWNLIKTTIIVIIFNNIRSSSSYHGYLIGRFQSKDLARVFSIHSITKMLLGKTKKENLRQKVKCVYCIHVLLCINCDEEWQASYENPSQPARHDNDAWKYWYFLLSCFLSGSKQ